MINKYPEEPLKDICPVTKMNLILLPYNEGKVVMNTNESKTQQSLIEEFSGVLHQRSDSIPGKKFRSKPEANAEPCNVRYARHVLIAYKDKLKIELDTLRDNGIISLVSKPLIGVAQLL